MASVSRQFSQPSYADFGPEKDLAPMFTAGVTPSLETWSERRRELRACWDAVLGTPPAADFDRTPVLIDSFELPECHARLFELPTSPDSRQKTLLMLPKDASDSPRPGAVVPFYNPDLMAGYDLATKEPKDAPNVHFGRHLVQQGYIVVCGQAFPYNTVPEPQSNEGFAWWKAAAAKLLHDHPQWTGMGRLVWDTRILTDFLLDQPGIDRDRILIIGHSLGGKMAFYNGCLDERIQAIVASDFGIAFDSTNWEAPWYLGDKVHDPELGVGHHHLLALNAPRSFFLIAGNCDGPVSWQYVNAVKEVYRLYGREDAVGILDHATGHRPPAEAVRAAYRWVAEQFGLPERSCTI